MKVHRSQPALLQLHHLISCWGRTSCSEKSSLRRTTGNGPCSQSPAKSRLPSNGGTHTRHRSAVASLVVSMTSFPSDPMAVNRVPQEVLMVLAAVLREYGIRFTAVSQRRLLLSRYHHRHASWSVFRGSRPPDFARLLLVVPSLSGELSEPGAYP